MTDPINWNELKQAAIEARSRSYSPYSGFSVGAALLAQTGEIFVGSNVENVSYGLSICAERVAIAHAVARGQREFQAIAVAAEPLAHPCGACRQFIIEFGEAIQILVFSAAHPDRELRYTSKELLPARFRM